MYVEGEATRKTSLAKDNPGARAVLNAVERLAVRAEAECEDYQADIRLKEGQLRDYEARVGTPFTQEEYADRLGNLRDKLKLSLSEKPPEGMEPASQLAAEIHALRDGNAIEAAPERTARKAARAERPVTARIRERLSPQEVQAEVEAQPTAEVIPLPVANPAEEKLEGGNPGRATAGVSGGVLPAMYQERAHARQVTKRRQADGAQLRLF